MTPLAYQLLYFDHMARGGDLAVDTLLARAAIARFVRSRGGQFVYLETR